MVQVKRPASTLDKLIEHLKEHYQPRNVEPGQPLDRIMFDAGERSMAQKVLNFINHSDDSDIEEE